MRNISLHNFIHRFIPLIVGLLLSISSEAQDFNYSFAKDSMAWQELNSQTILNSDNSAWNFSYKIPIGFVFNCMGKNFDSLRIETNGYLLFDNDRDYAFTAFAGFGDRIDHSGIHSVLGYSVSGQNENHILKIQFKNVGAFVSADQFFSYQIWLYESGNKIEMHMGPGNYLYTNPYNHITAFLSELNSLNGFSNPENIPFDSLRIDTNQIFRMGLLNTNMNGPIRGYFIIGNPSNPQGGQLNSQVINIPGLTSIPRQGMKYTFQPSAN
jgi:hypothetical protein